jgi:hypothetical protein
VQFCVTLANTDGCQLQHCSSSSNAGKASAGNSHPRTLKHCTEPHTAALPAAAATAPAAAAAAGPAVLAGTCFQVPPSVHASKWHLGKLAQSILPAQAGALQTGRPYVAPAAESAAASSTAGLDDR